MQVETIKPSDFSLWDNFVDCSHQGDVFCYSWWLDAVTKSNFRILVVKEDNRIVAGMPLAFDYHGKINLPPLTRTLGVLYTDAIYKSVKKKTSDERRWLMTLMAKIESDRFVQTCLHHKVADWLPYRWKGFSQTTRCTYLLDFRGKSISDLWNNLDDLRKRIIRKAERNNIRVSISDDIHLVHNYSSMTFRRQGLKFTIPYENLKILDDRIVGNGNRVILIAHSGDIIHAVLYAVFFGAKSAYYLLSGSDPDKRSFGAHTLVMWEALKYFHDKVSYFNFGGSDIKNIESHIKGFGGIQTPYFHIFNEDNLIGNNGLKYHLNKISYHTNASIKVLIDRIIYNKPSCY